MSRRLRWGATMWWLRLLYIPIELLVAARATGRYDLTRHTVSALGAADCSPAFCSPWHDLINGAFVAVGLLLVAGALMLASRIGPLVTVLLCVAGASSFATGLTPVDDGATLHAVAAAPLFAAQPLALLLLGRRMRPTRPRLAAALVLTGAVTAAAALAFVAGAPGAGLLERLALWPPIIAVAAVATVVRRQAQS